MLIPCSRLGSETGIPPSAFLRIVMTYASLYRRLFVQNRLSHLAGKIPLLHSRGLPGVLRIEWTMHLKYFDEDS